MSDSFDIEALAHDGGGRVAVLWLDPGDKPVVVLNEHVLARLDATLEGFDPEGFAGLVLASRSPRAFVAGADLKSIMAMDDPALDAYLAFGQRVFGRLSQLPISTAAAIGGAALGGGMELAMHCDLLVGAPRADGKAYPVGLPEAGLGICPGWGGTNLLPARLDPGQAIEMTRAGRPVVFDEAMKAGVFDAVTTPEDLVSVAADRVAEAACPDRDGAPSRWIGRTAPAVRGALESLPAPETEAGVAVDGCVVAGLQDGWQASLDAERSALVRLRGTDEARGRIEAFFASRSGAGR